MVKVIIDTNVFISTFCFGGKSAKLLDIIFKDKFSYCNYITAETFLEVKNKFLNGRVNKILNDKFNYEQAIEFLKDLDSKSLQPKLTLKTKINLCRDPEDNMLLELAYCFKANYIISGDKDLLVLNRERFEGYTFNIVDVSGFLELI